jgi:Fe2+ transport system protein B
MALQFIRHAPDSDDSVSEVTGRALEDLYHYLLTASWPALIALITGFFFLANALFAVGYCSDCSDSR